MEQEKFVYALYHEEEESVESILDGIDPVKEYNILVSINATGCRGKDPISDKRTTVEIRTEDDSTFENLDTCLEENFVEIWFEH